MTTIAEAPTPTRIVFGTDGWRARIADEFTFENVRRCADGVARYVVDRGETAKGVVIAYDRRFASEHFAMAAAEVLLAHDIPVAFAERAVPTQMSSYEVVERGAAAGVVITASHNPWTDNGFKVKAPTGAAGGPEMLSGHRGGDRLERRHRDRAPAVRRGRGGRAGRALRPVRRATRRYVRRTLDLDALQGGRHPPARRADVRRRGRLDPAAARRRPDPGHRDPPRAQPVLRWREPRADPAVGRRGARDARGRRLRPGPPARRRRGPGRSGRRARHVHPPAPGHRAC